MLQDYALPQTSGVMSSIASLTIKANNFELCPTLVTFVEIDQLGGYPIENPYIHFRNFLMKCDPIKFNRVSINAIQLRFFPFSLKHRASDWLQNEEPHLFTTWDDFSNLSSISTSHQARWLGCTQTSPPFRNKTVSPYIKFGNHSKIFNANAHIMAFPTSS